MNFTEKVKQELGGVLPNPRHCRMAELGGVIAGAGIYNAEEHNLVISSENELVIKTAEKLLNKIFSVDNFGRTVYDIKRSGRESGKIILSGQETEKIEETLKLRSGELTADPVLYTMTCCKRAFLRGAFLASGSLTDPNKDYHFEISHDNEAFAEELRNLINSFGADAKLVKRKKQYVVYVKDSGMISELLNIMGAHVAMMELENVKILKELRNRVNRQVNCDSANINKALKASGKQLEDIRYIREKTGFEGMAEELIETAELREQYPEASLAELVMYNGDSVGKSGLNHRLKRISAIAEKLREEEKTHSMTGTEWRKR
ncbi:MAG: DNA-binding protein WhiA [Lachnospiraceae bacterium]|nr:DNA-binding protein WhiA [Lachnospiraceae bacterium]